MAFEENYIGTDEIRIGKEGYQKEQKNPCSHYDEDSAEKAQKGSIVPVTEGLTAKPSQATRNKARFQERERFSRKEDGLHVLADYFPLTIGRCEDTLQYTGDYKRVTDYHEAMIDLIEREHYEEGLEKALAEEEK